MSPLVRSLLALAALIAAADAQTGACGFATIGQRSPRPTRRVEVSIPAGGGSVTVPDYCQQQHLGQLVGENVKACNNDPIGGLPPVVQPTDQDNPRMPFDVICPEDGCVYSATAYVVQYCR